MKVEINFKNNGKQFLSIITPTFNREKTIERTYESLQRQTCKDFRWIIIDDGSTDDTLKVVETFQKKSNGFHIVYKKKPNGGKHTALNCAYKYLKKELVMVLDSDDYLIDNAVERINEKWQEYKYNSDICGMSFLKGKTTEEQIGDKFSEDNYIASYIDVFCGKHNVTGDKIEVYRADILKQYPFPTFENERFIGEGMIWFKIGLKYKTVYINEIIYICVYLEGGLSKLGRKLRIKCPLGGMECAKTYIHKRSNFKIRIKNMVLYECYGFFARKSIRLMFGDLKKFIVLFVLTLMFAFCLYEFWKIKYEGI